MPFLFFLLLPLALPAFLFCGLALAELIASFWPVVTPAETGDACALVLIPAHNEEASIAKSLARQLPEVPASFEVVVLADNCTDGTAAVAATFPRVTVWNRHEPAAKGKGGALRHAAARILREKNNFAAVIFLDVDTFAPQSTLLALANTAAKTQCPVQAADGFAAAPDSAPGAPLSLLGLWWSTLVREQGRSRLRLPAFLHGTAMAVPLSLLPLFDELKESCVEDKQLTAACVFANRPPLFLFSSPFHFHDETPHLWPQRRKRWEAGHLAATVQLVPRLIAAAFHQKRVGLLLFAVDFALPPLFLLFSAATALLSFWPWPFGIVMALFALGGISKLLLSPWRGKFRMLLNAAPFWMGAKIRNYATLASRRHTDLWQN